MKHFKSLIIALIIMLGACDQPGTLENKKQKLEELRDEFTDLKSKIRQLEKEVDRIDTSNDPLEEATLVRTNPVQRKNFNTYAEVTGNAISKKNVLLSSEISGRVVEIIPSEGDMVKKDAPLIRLDDQLIRSNIDEIQTQLELARKVYKRQKNLWDKNIGSEIQYLQARNKKETLEKRLASARKRLEKTTIQAPFGGKIDNLLINEGEFAAPGRQLIRIVNLSEMRINAEVSDAYLGKIQNGDTVEVSILPVGLKKTLPVTHVADYINPGSRSFRIEIKIPNEDRRIKPNVLARIRFSIYNNKKALVIPSKILQQSKEGNYIYITKEAGGSFIARKKMIETGHSYKGETEVISGLKGDENLITQGFREVTDEEKVVTPDTIKPGQ